MTDKILEINEVNDFKMDDYSHGSGYEIITAEQKITFIISNGQSCCESWGYLWSNDNVKDFIGANIKNIYVTDIGLNNIDIYRKKHGLVDLDGGGIIFINIDTYEHGKLQFVAYNSHNGYYGHTVKIESIQLKLETAL